MESNYAGTQRCGRARARWMSGSIAIGEKANNVTLIPLCCCDHSPPFAPNRLRGGTSHNARLLPQPWLFKWSCLAWLKTRAGLPAYLSSAPSRWRRVAHPAQPSLYVSVRSQRHWIPIGGVILPGYDGCERSASRVDRRLCPNRRWVAAHTSKVCPKHSGGETESRHCTYA